MITPKEKGDDTKMSDQDRFYSLEDDGTPVPDSGSLIDAYDALFGASDKSAEASAPKTREIPVADSPAPSFSIDIPPIPSFDFSGMEIPSFDFTGATTPTEEMSAEEGAPSSVGEATPIATFDFGTVSPDFTKLSAEAQEILNTSEFSAASAETPDSEQYAHSSGETVYRKKEKEKKKFREGFRIFKKGAKDSPIYETQEDESMSESPTDDFTPDEGEDVFEAAERSNRKKKGSGVFNRDARSAENLSRKAKAKKKDEVISSVKALAKTLAAKSKIQKIQIILLAVLTFVSFVFYMLPSFYSAGNALEPIFANGGAVYGLINIGLLVLIAAAGYDRFWSGIKTFGTMRFIGNTGLVILFVLVLVHDGYTMIKGVCGLGGNDLYTVYAAFAFLISIIGERLRTAICFGNLSVVAQGAVMDSINSVDDRADAKVLAKGVFGSDDKILYCAGAEVVRNLRQDMGLRHEEKGFYPAAYTMVLIAAVVCGIIMGVRNGLGNIVTGLVACVCLCAPTVIDFARTLLLFFKNRQLNGRGGAVLDFKGTEQMGKAKGIVMDASDIFTVEVRDYVTANKLFVSEADVPVLAASLLKYGGSMLFPAFFYRAEKTPLPLAENIEYIPRAGFKGRVGTHNVMVGNRKLLTESGADVLSEKVEAGKCKDGALYYIAIDGHTSAYFIVSYEVRNSIKVDSASFRKTGLVLFLTSKEPFLGENYVSNKMKIDVHSIKFISSDGRDIMDEYRRNKSMRALSSLVCARKKKFIFNLAVWAQRFYDADRFVFGANIVGQVIFFLLMIAAVFMDISLIFSPITIIVLHCLWGGASVLIGQLKK